MWTIVKIVFFRIFVTKLPRFTMKHDPRRSLTMAHSEVIVLAMLSAATPGSMWHLKPWLGWVSPWSIHVGGTVYLPTLRIMGSQNWWFGDPRTLLYRFKPFYRRVQRFLGYMNSRYLDGFSGREKNVPFRSSHGCDQFWHLAKGPAKKYIYSMWFHICFIFTPKIGLDSHFDYIIFFKWVKATN